MKGGPGPLSLLFAGLEFGGRKLQGQTNLQAGVGAGASAAGGSGRLLLQVLPLEFFPGIGTDIGAGIGGLLGGMIGANLAGGAADMVTGANKPKTKTIYESYDTEGNYRFEVDGQPVSDETLEERKALRETTPRYTTEETEVSKRNSGGGWCCQVSHPCSDW